MSLAPVRRQTGIVVVGIAIWMSAVLPLSALAKAPPPATTILPTNVVASPEADAPVLAVIPADAQVALSGSVSPGYLEIEYAGETAWVPAQYLTLGHRPGIDNAVTVSELPLHTAPLPEAEGLDIIPEGEVVILNGASVAGYDAASHDGIGGWLEERGFARW
jgi:hypothetical protein